MEEKEALERLIDIVFGAGKSGACREWKWRARAVGRREHERYGRKGELGSWWKCGRSMESTWKKEARENVEGGRGVGWWDMKKTSGEFLLVRWKTKWIFCASSTT